MCVCGGVCVCIHLMMRNMTLKMRSLYICRKGNPLHETPAIAESREH